MGVAPMSRWTKRAYLRLCPEKRRKKEFGPQRVKKTMVKVAYETSIAKFLLLYLIDFKCENVLE